MNAASEIRPGVGAPAGPYGVERIRGDHYIFTRDSVEEILNLQPKGAQAKPYQVKQVRNLIHKYGVDIENGE